MPLCVLPDLIFFLLLHIAFVPTRQDKCYIEKNVSWSFEMRCTEDLSMSRNASQPTRIASVEKALSILNLFAERRCDLSATEVSRHFGFNFSSTHHLLATLVAGAYLTQDAKTRKYRLGIKALELGFAAREAFLLAERAQPFLEELSAEINENVNLAVLDGHEVVYIQQVTSSRALSMFTRLGARAPLHCTGVGKVYLADMPPGKARDLAELGGWIGYTPSTITNWDDMQQELVIISEQGYAIDHEEREEGVVCVACAVRDFSAEVVAAISVSGPSTRMLQRLDCVAKHATKYARALSHSLGYRPE